MVKLKYLFILNVLFLNSSLSAQVDYQETPDGSGYILTRNKKPVDNIIYSSIDREYDYWSVIIEKENTSYMGAYDLQGKKIIPAEYSRLEQAESKSFPYAFIAEKKGKTAFYDEKGNLLSETNREAYPFCGGKRMVSTLIKDEENGGISLYGFFDVLTGKEVVTPKYRYWQSVGSDYVTIGKSGEQGLLHYTGQVVEPIYDEIYSDGDSVIFILIKDGLSSVYLPKEKRILSGKYTGVYENWPLIGLELPATENAPSKKIVFYNEKSRTFLKDTANEFNVRSEFGITVKFGDKWYLAKADNLKKSPFPGNFDQCYFIIKNILVVEKNNKVGLITKSGNPLTDFKYDVIGVIGSPQQPSCLFAENSGKKAILSLQGLEISAFSYDRISTTSFDKWVEVGTDNKHSFFDLKTRKELFAPKYEFLTIITIREKPHGIIYQINQKKGLLNNQGNELTTSMYDGISSSSYDGWMELNLENKKGLFDLKSGKIIVPTAYDFLSVSSSGDIYAGKNGKYGLISADNHIIIPFDYDESFSFYKGKSRVKKGNENFEINRKNERVK